MSSRGAFHNAYMHGRLQRCIDAASSTSSVPDMTSWHLHVMWRRRSVCGRGVDCGRRSKPSGPACRTGLRELCMRCVTYIEVARRAAPRKQQAHQATRSITPTQRTQNPQRPQTHNASMNCACVVLSDGYLPRIPGDPLTSGPTPHLHTQVRHWIGCAILG